MRRLLSPWLVGLAALTLCALWGTLSGSAAADDPAQRHLELKQLMLELINDARSEAGAPTVRLGVNGAAQLHAEQMVAECFHSHWGRDGLKPYMRYSLLGGYQSNAENVRGADRYFGSNRCAVAPSTQRPPLEFLVRDAMDAWLQSPGHRRTLLDPAHHLVNVGIAWRGGGNAYIFRAVQHFEGDYARLDQLPSLAAGRLTLSGRTINEASPGPNPTVYVYYDTQPQPQARAALDATGSYCGGHPVAAVFPNARWVASASTPNCIEPGASIPRSDGAPITLPTIVAEEWRITDTAFTIRADLSSILQRHGSGVYTITLVGERDADRIRLVEYSLLHGIVPLNRAFVYSGAPTTASELNARIDLSAVFRWDGAAWRGYAERDGAPLPGSIDFAVAVGDWLWLSDRD